MCVDMAIQERTNIKYRELKWRLEIRLEIIHTEDGRKIQKIL